MNNSKRKTNGFDDLIDILTEYNKEHNNFFSDLEIYLIANVIMTALNKSNEDSSFSIPKKHMFTYLYLFKDCKLREDEFYSVVYEFLEKVFYFNPTSNFLGDEDIYIVNNDPDHQKSRYDDIAQDEQEMYDDIDKHEEGRR